MAHYLTVEVAVLAGAASLFFVLPAAYAEETGSRKDAWTLESDSLTTFKDSADVMAEGGVVLKRPAAPGVRPIELQTDWLNYNSKKQEVQARGRLLYQTEEEMISASAARLDIDNQTGTLNDITLLVKGNDVYFSGQVLEKTGEVSYRLADGRVTACRVKEGHSAPWSFGSRSATVTVDEFAVLNHVTFRIKDFPVLYTPYLVFPVKSARESGLLFPEISNSSRNGFGITVPYFFNISPSVDATLYPGFLSKRGVNLATEFRYVLAAEDRGTFLANYLKDKTTDNQQDDYKNDGFLRTLHDRYWLRGKADQQFGNHVVARLDFDLVSDRDYLREYREGISGYSRSNLNFVKTFNRGLQEESIPFRESAVQLSYAADHSLWGGEFRGVADTTRETASTKQIHTLPRLIYNSQALLGDSPVHFDWQSEYVNYWREEGLGYQRLDLYPRLRLSMPAGQLIEGRLRGGVRETLYRVQTYGDGASSAWQAGHDQNRTVYDFEANTAFVLAREFAVAAGSVRWLNHAVRPNLRYSYVTTRSQNELPLLDSDDRIAVANGLTYELNNYFKLGGQINNSNYERYLGYFKVWQTFNISEERRGLASNNDQRHPFSDVNFDLLTYPLAAWSTRYQTALNVYGAGVTRYSLETRYTQARGDYLSLDYIYAKGQNCDVKLGLQLRLVDELTLKADTTRSLLLDRTVNDSVGLLYSPHCWSIEVNYSKNSDDQRVMLIFSLAGIGKALEFGKDNL